jgi:cell division protein ZapA
LKQIEVTILGQSYVLGCPDGGETLLASAVAAVDQEMSAIRSGGKLKARERIAVLAALNLAYRLAERPAAEAQSAAPAGDASAGARGGDGDGEAGSDIDLDALIRRVDVALGNDGQLI